MSWFMMPLMPFRAALAAVKPHADDTVRFVPSDEMHVVATDRISAVVARVEITEREDGECPVIEIRADDVPKLLAVFKPPKDKDARAEAMIRVRPVFTVKPPDDDALVATSQDGSAAPVFMAEVVFSDADGLFDGQSLSVPALTTDVPDVRSIIAGALSRDPWLWEIEATLSHDFMGKLSAACKAYGAHAQLRYVQYSAGRIGMVGTVGEKLAAFQVVAPVETNPNGVPWPEITRREWAARLRGLTVADQVSTWLMTVTAPTHDDDVEEPADDAAPVTPLPGQQEIPLDPDDDGDVLYVDFTEPRRTASPDDDTGEDDK